MGRLVVTEYVSLDGVVEAPGGGEDFVHAGWTFRIERGPEGDAFKLDETRNSDALVFGRVTYEGMAAVWPDMTGEFADLFNGLPKFVISDTCRTRRGTTPKSYAVTCEPTSTRSRSASPATSSFTAALASCKHCSSSTSSTSCRLMLFPIVLGSGKKLFAESDDTKRFGLTSTTVMGDGIAVLTYAPVSD